MNYRLKPTALAAASLGFLLCTSLASAQTAAAPDAAQLLQNLNKTSINSTFGSGPQILQDAQTRKRIGPAAGGKAVSIDVKGFNVSGITTKVRLDVRKVLAAHVGANRSFDQLEAAAEALQIALRQDGYFLAQVDIPQQSIQNGVIELRVIQGYLDAIELKPLAAGVRGDRDQILSILNSHLKPGQVIHTQDIERALFLVSDLSALRVESVIEAGSKPGTAKLVVGVTAGTENDNNVDFDNYGSRFTGEYRIGVGVSVNAPAKRGDVFKLTGMTTTNEGTQFVRASYQSPVGSSGLKLGAAISSLKYKLGTATFTPLKASGQGDVASVFALYPAIRSRNLNTFLQANLEYRSIQDKMDATQVNNKSNATVFSLAAVGDSRDNLAGGGINNFSVGVVSGRLSLDTPSLLLNDQAATGRQTNGNYAKLTYGMIRQQHVWTDAAQPNNRLVLYTSLQGQMAAKNLSSGEKMAMGGPAGIRAYAAGEGVGDGGHIFTWELRKSILGDNVTGDLVFTVFGDYGYSLTNKTMLSTDKVSSIHMAGHGVGVNYQAPGGTLVKLSIAQRGPKYAPLGDPEDRLPRIYFSLSKPL